MSGGMNDVLAERFAALADLRDDSDWLDVRRRARRRVRLAVPLAATLAAAFAAVAVASSGGWLFADRGHAVRATTSVVVHGHTWHIEASRLCTRITSAGQPSQSNCGVRTGPPFGARSFDVDGGQIWVGMPLGFIRSVSITDTNGRVHTVSTSAPPRGTKTPSRFWVIGLDGTKAASISARDRRGHTFRKTVS